MFSKARKNRKGFTLVELLVVVAIIGVLAAIAIPKFTDATASANGAKVQADLRAIDSAIMIFYASNNGYPSAFSQLVTNYLAATPKEPSGTIKIKGTTVNSGSYAITQIGSTYRATFNSSTVEQLPQ